jgi:carboxymethylenebutenolidase
MSESTPKLARAMSVQVVDGTATGELFVPPSASPAQPCPLVVMYPDAFGLRDDLSSLGEHLASLGYAVLQVDPFWRFAPYAPFDPKTAFGDPDEKTRLFALLAKVSFDQTLADTQALVASLAGDERVATDRIGAMGYCMGGRFAILAAIRWPETIAAAASIHGGGLVTPKPDSPHLAASAIRAALYFAVADNDGSCTPEMQTTLKHALDEAHVRYELEVYAGCAHGFGVPGTGVHDAAATARYWEKVGTLFETSLTHRG